MANELPIYTVDAFTRVPFSGNPAAVCLVSDPQSLTDEQRQSIAAEMNHSETAFVELLKPEDNFKQSNNFSLRWFTPVMEVNLCGHATLATAAVLFNVIDRGSNLGPSAELANMLICAIDDRSSVSDLLKTLGCYELIEEVRYSPEMDDLLVILKPVPRSAFEKLAPNTIQMTASKTTYRLLCITCKAVDSLDKEGNPHDFLSRVFAPWTGISEDPVTGSSYTVTGPYWANVLRKKTLYARQASKRGGDISLHIKDDRLEIIGGAVITLKGSFLL